MTAQRSWSALLRGWKLASWRWSKASSPLAAWKERMVTLGRPIEARSPDGRVLSGVALDVLQDGSLLLRLDDGSEQIVRAADVTWRGSNNEP